MAIIIMDACNNHLGNKNIIMKMIEEAAKNGANYIKFQLYDHLLLNYDYPNYDSVKDNLKNCEIEEDQLDLIFKLSLFDNIKPMFTIFNENRINLLKKFYDNNLDFALKIASPDMSNYKLQKEIIENFPTKLILISCGMHEDSEIETMKNRNNSLYDGLKYMYCISKYPTKYKEIRWRDCARFDGFSDHTIGIGAGIKYIKENIMKKEVFYEKHFTLSRNLPGKDQQISIEPRELRVLSGERDYWIGTNNYKKRWNR